MSDQTVNAPAPTSPLDALRARWTEAGLDAAALIKYEAAGLDLEDFAALIEGRIAKAAAAKASAKMADIESRGKLTPILVNALVSGMDLMSEGETSEARRLSYLGAYIVTLTPAPEGKGWKADIAPVSEGKPATSGERKAPAPRVRLTPGAVAVAKYGGWSFKTRITPDGESAEPVAIFRISPAGTDTIELDALTDTDGKPVARDTCTGLAQAIIGAIRRRNNADAARIGAPTQHVAGKTDDPATLNPKGGAFGGPRTLGHVRDTAKGIEVSTVDGLYRLASEPAAPAPAPASEAPAPSEPAPAPASEPAPVSEAAPAPEAPASETPAPTGKRGKRDKRKADAPIHV